MPDTSPSTLREVCSTAARSTFLRSSAAERAHLLREIARCLEEDREQSEATAAKETNLPAGRLTGEMNRTLAQIRMFASHIERPETFGIRIEEALPDRKPLPRPDLRRVLLPLGPVAVFGASNFPLAFSIAGGDTASALAAGCPVVAKAHPAHLETCRLVARAIARAGLPEGAFAMVEGGAEVGQALAADPSISAIGFTGSYTAGRALWEASHRRPVPIPVFAEMGSVNPVVVLPGALQDGSPWVRAYAESLVLGVGQFCTSPGLLLGTGIESFAQSVAEWLDQQAPGVMLTPGILANYESGVRRLRSVSGVRELTTPRDGSAPALFLAERVGEPWVIEEVFGPCAVAIETPNPLAVLHELPGQLTGTVLMGEDDDAQEVIQELSRVCGRVIVNGMPTGVEVGEAMQHGGPWPASTDPRFTSVGTAAIERWLRPVCYQNVPHALLPPALR